MPVPSTINDLSPLEASNSPQDSEIGSASNGPDDYFRALSAILKRQFIQAADVAASSTLAVPLEGRTVKVVGPGAITGFAPRYAGRELLIEFAAGITITHGASLLLPGSANVTTQAGDIGLFVQRDASAWKCVSYARADGTVLGAADATAIANSALATANTANSTANTANSTANSAISQSGTALATANSAVSTANSAVSTANSASSTASTAYSAAISASSQASEAWRARVASAFVEDQTPTGVVLSSTSGYYAQPNLFRIELRTGGVAPLSDFKYLVLVRVWDVAPFSGGGA